MEELDAVAASRVGRTIGEWTIERVLGIGAMASVFAGKRRDGAIAALKVLHPHFSDVPEVRKRFLREGPLGRALATMAPLCDGIPQVMEGGIADDGAAYLAMELLVGEALSERLARAGILPPGEALALADQVLGVLLMAHTYGVIHRDLKPENLHIGRDGKVKVLDFGIARVLDPLPDGVPVLPEKTATTAGMTLGTCHYMAPEQAAGLIADIDGRTDLFGLGATLFELLSGRTIHPDLPGSQLLVAAATEPAPSLASAAPDLPADVCAVVDRALAFRKTERYPNANVMRSDVRALRQQKSPPYARGVAEGRIKPGALR
ncbi:MAG TPA: serine/threonine-protein kinase [Polyangiaceae bacterium]|nr:serine/threonine-protein kinase [Polyangiaceae bacterium]